VKEVRVVYPKPKTKPVFWRPFAPLTGHDRVPSAARLALIEIGWLWLYILIYIPALFLTRVVLKVA